MWELIKKLKSTDGTIKYVVRSNKRIMELSYINKDDGKDIICVPSQTMCNVGCKFCHTTDYIGKIDCYNLTDSDIYEGVRYVYEQETLGNKVLLISYMGCGEPTYNTKNVISSMQMIKERLSSPYTRFAVATCLPNSGGFFTLVDLIKHYNLPVKLHLSLHYTIDSIRKEWMPASIDIMPALAAVDFYKKYTSNSVEIHYALLDGVNDTEQDAILLSTFLKDKDINVKFLFYNEKPTLKAIASNKSKLNIFRRYLDKYNIQHEYYIPPGLDIGASCGQFLMDYYE